MTFKDIFKQSVLQQFQAGENSVEMIAFSLLFSLVMALYLFVIYRHFVRKSMYNMNLNIALVGMTVITTAVILTIQSNLVLSLGMVGALSIVRYRTSIKDPMDLFFLFWAIANGMMCGAGQYLLNVIVTLMLTVVVFALTHFPTVKAPYVMIINGQKEGLEENIVAILEKNASYHKIKSRNISGNSERMIIEVRIREPKTIMDEIGQLKEVEKLSLLTYEGDIVA